VNMTNKSNPISITSLTNWTSMGQAMDVVVKGGYAYVVGGDESSSDSADGLTIFDVSNDSVIKQVGHIETLNDCEEVYVHNNIAYLACYTSSSIGAINVSDKTNPVLLDTHSLITAGSVCGDNEKIYGGEQRLRSLIHSLHLDRDYTVTIPKLSSVNFAYVNISSYDPVDDASLTVNGDVVFNEDGSWNGSNITRDFSPELNSELSGCSEDANGNCEIYIELSIGTTTLENLNISYTWNITTLPLWDWTWRNRTNILVNTSYGNAKNIFWNNTFKMSNDLTIDAFWVNQNSTEAEWDNKTIAITADKLINISDITFTEGQSMSNLINHSMWTNDFPNATTATQTQSETLSNALTTWKNYTIHWYKTDEITEESTGWLTNTTWDGTIDDSNIKSRQMIEVYNGGAYYNITPETCTADCNTVTPTYTEKTANGNKYWVCMQDVNADVNSVCEYFKVIVEKNKE